MMTKRNKIKHGKQGWALVMYTLLAVFLAGCTQTATETAKQETAVMTGEDQAQTSGKLYKLGDTVVAGELSYQINKAESEQKIGDGGIAVETDQQFIVLQLTVANNGPEAQLIDPSLFKLKDGQGNEFDPMVDGDMYVNQSEPFFLQDVYPGTPRAGNIVFEVPADAEQLQLIVQSGIGFEGDQAETITLPLP